MNRRDVLSAVGTMVVVALVVGFLIGGHWFESPEVRAARAEATIKQVELVAPIKAFAIATMIVFGMFTFCGFAGAFVALAWKRVLLVYARDGIFPLLGWVDPNRRIDQDATPQQMTIAMGALHVQNTVAQAQAKTAGAIKHQPNVLPPPQEVVSRMPAIRVVDDSAQTARLLAMFEGAE